MQNYILLLVGVLIVLLIGVIFYGWRKMTQLEIEISKNKYDVEALRNLISKMLDTQDDSDLVQNYDQTNAQILNNMQNIQNMDNTQMQYNVDMQQTMMGGQMMNQTQMPENIVEKLEDNNSITIESVETSETTGMLLTDSSDSEVLSANFPNIRMYNVKKALSNKPLNNTEGEWINAIGENIIEFSAAGYFFAKYVIIYSLKQIFLFLRHKNIQCYISLCILY